jgi:diacylglycerol kinase (ATP)
MATDARMDDGFLDLDVFSGTGFAASIRTALGVITGLHVRDPRHSVYRGRKIRIESDKPLAVHVDGEPYGTTPLDSEVIPLGLTVLLPHHSRSDLFTQSPPAPAAMEDSRG